MTLPGGKSKFYIIVTGPSRSGKDTFIEAMMAKITEDYKAPALRSTIADLHSFLEDYGVNRRTPEGRKILAETKTFLDNFDFLYTRKQHKDMMRAFNYPRHHVITQLREQVCIDFIKKDILNNQSKDILPIVIKVISKEAIKNCPDNHADKEAIDIQADYTIVNDGSINDLEQKAYDLVDQIHMYGKLLSRK